MRLKTRMKLGACIVLAAPIFSTAASGQSTDEREEPSSEIVVTGSQIRGIAPAGSNVIGLTADDIAATGASNTNQLLAKLPQAVNYFNSLPQPGGGVPNGNSTSTINRPNLRNLPGSSTSGTALTLVLIDGHRVVGAGIGTVAVDPDAIPPGAIERIEAITDGGSAVYGSDAIGGVLNFITRRRFDGIQVGAHYGFAKDYWTRDANIIAGKDWGSGSFYAAYSYAQHDDILGSERDYVRNVDWNPSSATFGLGQNRSCDNPNISVGARFYPLPAGALGIPNNCDISDYQTVYGKDRQHHGLASLTQQLSDALRFDVKAFYTWRQNEGNSGPPRGSVSIRPTNPNYRNLAGTPDAGANQIVSFSYGPVFGNDELTARTTLETWNITPQFTYDLGGSGNWQLRALFNYGESTTTFNNRELFAARQTAAAASTNPATALNPYNIAATPRTVLGGLLANNVGTGRHQFTDYKAIVDGALFKIPGGDVRVAFGGEYMISNYKQRRTNTADYTLPPPVSYRQTVSSLFGEIQVPLFGQENGFSGMELLTFSASARYDKYNDFGDTFNPKFAVTWKPLDWVTLTGNWGKSFAAPSAADQLGPLTSAINISNPGNYPNTAALNPSLVPGEQYYSVVLIRGTVENLKPQRTINWSVGGKIEPPFIPGLTLGASYYFIRYMDAINSPFSGSDSQPFFQQFPELVTVDPTAAQLAAFVSQVNGGTANLAAGIPNVAAANTPGGPRVVSMYDIRARNLGVVRLAGIDFNANYRTDTGFGGIDATFAGNYQTMRKSQLSPNSPVIDTLRTNEPKLRFLASLGADVGDFRAQATLYHTAGYDVVRGGTLFQDRIGAFNTVNLFFKYDLKGSGMAKDLTLTLNLDNVLDTDPPLKRDGGARQNGFDNGFTIGRLVQLGITKKF